MNIILDIVGSLIIGGLVVLMVLNVNLNYTRLEGNQTFTKLVQSNATVGTALIENDFRKIGYRCTDSIKITVIDTAKVTALGDFDDNGVIDTLSYYLDRITPVYNAPNNTKIKMLYRKVNSQTPAAINLGFTHFRLWYFDSLGNPTLLRSKIRTLKFAIQLESPYKYQATSQYDTGYYSMYWERIIKPKNLK